MSSTLSGRLDRLLHDLPLRYKGPGGALAVLRHGEVLVRHAWGFANAERRIPVTPATLVRVCSITKQFTCAVVLDAFPDPAALDAAVAARLPRLEQPPPGALHLCHNQSGLRDYWAVAMLHGAPAESAFGDTEAERVIGGTRTLQFTPGTQYSYCNQNFRILSDAAAERTGRSFAELLRRSVLEPAGMASALLAADTRAMPDGTEGYEGSQATGFRAAENRIVWTGDAGLGASLDDMIAWERFIDAGRDDPQSLYGRLSAPVHFADGAPAEYGFGLGRRVESDRPVTGHGGALRGWRASRLYAPSERVSVVVLFNHSGETHSLSSEVLAAVLGEERPKPVTAPLPAWLGTYLDPETGLSVRVGATEGRVRVRYGPSPEQLDVQPDGTAGVAGTRLELHGQDLVMTRPLENRRVRLRPVGSETPEHDVAGRYRCAELDAELLVADAGGALYGAFSGFLGQGRMELLEPVGPDLWALPCPRALDFAPPGDWTLGFSRDGAGVVESVEVGCWLARGLRYRRL